MLKTSERPKLRRHARLRWDEKTGQAFLLYPERGLRLDATGLRILRLCEGERSFAEIVALLAQESHGPAELISADVRSFLKELSLRGLLDGLIP